MFKLIIYFTSHRPSPPYQRAARKDPPRRSEPSKPANRASGNDRGGRGPSDRRADARSGGGGRGGARGSDKDKNRGGKSDKVLFKASFLFFNCYI